MGIEKGRDWGAPGRLAPDSPIFTSDRQLAAFLETGRPMRAALAGGDLARTLGVKSAHDFSSAAFVVPVDAIRVRLDDRPAVLAVAHVVVGHLLWSRGAVAIMNAAFIGRRNVAPRAHPGDGKLDVVTFDLGVTDRVKAVRRMPAGSHLPHPGISAQRRANGLLRFDSARPVRVDGRRAGRVRELEFSIVSGIVELAV